MINNKSFIYKTFIVNTLICILLPNFIGCIFSLYLYKRFPKNYYGILFLSLFVIFLTYNFYSVDNTLRFIRALNGLTSEGWISGNPLDYILMFSQTFFHVESSLIFYIYILFAYLLWYYTLNNNGDYNQSKVFIVLLICAIPLRNIIDLLYFTLSVLFTTYFISKKTFRNKISNWTLLLIGVYILHPGLFLLLIPCIIFFIIDNNNKILYYSCIIAIYLIGIILAHSQGLSTGIDIIDVQLESFNHYTSEGKWGIRETTLSGITYTIQFYILPTIYTIICFIATIRRKYYIKQDFILKLFQVCILFYPSFISFVTISERILVTMSICAYIIMYKMVLMKSINPYYITTFTVITFMFTTIRCSAPISLNGIFKEGTYEDVRFRCYYTPSLLLLDYNKWGFSDEFIQKNSFVFNHFYDK